MSKVITGLSRRREQALQERLILRQARRFESRTRREITRAMRALADAYGEPGKDAAALAEHRERIRRILDSEWRSAFATFGPRILDAALKSFRPGETKVDEVPATEIYDRAVSDWIRANGAQRVTEIGGTTAKQAEAIINAAAAQAIADGLDEGSTASAIQRAIRSEGGSLSAFRSRVISRTETHNASQAATQAAAEASGIPMRREWVASGGERTRSTHAAASGQVRGMQEPFEVGGVPLMYPGDPNGPADETINCRCVVAMIVA